MGNAWVARQLDLQGPAMKRPLLLLLLAATATVVRAGAPERHAHGRKSSPAACQQMMDDLRASDTRFDEAVQRMNDAQGADKVEAIAAALNELAAGRRTMREHMASMPCPGLKSGAQGCPMMGR